MRYVNLQSLIRGASTCSKKYPRTGIGEYGEIRHRWEQIKERCEVPTSDGYKHYGARGIRLSPEFHDPVEFAKYVVSLDGWEPQKGLHLDRIDNNRGYERDNLRWVTAYENNRNKRGLLNVVWRGESMCFKDFITEHTVVSFGWARERYHAGMSLEELAGHPPGKKSIRRIERERNITFPSSGHDSP